MSAIDFAQDTTEQVLETDLWTAVQAWLLEAGTRLLAVAAIVAVAVVVAWILRIIIRRVVDRIVHGAKSRANVLDTQALERSPLASLRLVQRTRTLGSILQNIVGVAVVIVSGLLIVNVLAPNALGSLTLLTAAIGAGLGFGAQNIVKDVLNGIFIVAEDQIGIGDVVDLGLATGIVEYVSVRITHVRDVHGTLWYVRNGEITRIGNMSQGWSRVVLDIGVARAADVDRAEAVMLTAATDLAEDPKWRTRVIEPPEVWGLESIGGDAIVVRVVIKTRAGARDDVGQELRTRVRRALDADGIDVPHLSTVTLTGPDAAQRVRGANPPKTKPNPLAPATDELPASPRWRFQRGADAPPTQTAADDEEEN